ncbi:MAG: hypothetical protein HQL25_02190 [Candidatus Omnitrophica bacterium]|nr:hypothetical protein [Candidatus Omnitrophota bacterium]
MKKSLRSIINTLFISQILIWGCAIAFISGMLIIQRAGDNLTDWLNNFSKETEQVILLVTQTENIDHDQYPEQLNVFAIKPESEEFIFKRKLKNINDEVLWESYRSKILYQMQQNKQGIIFYPEHNGLDFFSKQKAIRYDYIKKLDWIVAVESELDRSKVMLKNLFSLSNVIFIIFVIGLATVFSFMCFKYVLKIFKKIISDAIESGIVKLNHSVGNEETAPFTPSNINDDTFYFKTTLHDNSPTNQIIPNIKPTIPIEPEIQEKPIIQIKQKEPDLTLDVKGIKSTTLKKIIQELRAQK